MRAGCREPVGAPGRCSPWRPDERSLGQGPQSPPQHCWLLPAAAPASCSARRCPQPMASPKFCAAWAGGEAAATRCAPPHVSPRPRPSQGTLPGPQPHGQEGQQGHAQQGEEQPGQDGEHQEVGERCGNRRGGVPSVPGAGNRLEGLWGASPRSLPRVCSRSVALVWGRCLAPPWDPMAGGAQCGTARWGPHGDTCGGVSLPVLLSQVGQAGTMLCAPPC